jgi:hypothetical protein
VPEYPDRRRFFTSLAWNDVDILIRQGGRTLVYAQRVMFDEGTHAGEIALLGQAPETNDEELEIVVQAISNLDMRSASFRLTKVKIEGGTSELESVEPYVEELRFTYDVCTDWKFGDRE